MKQIELMKDLHVFSDEKIVMLIMDGLGGLPNESGLTEIEALRNNWGKYDILFHIKKSDPADEDGNFSAKVTVIEEMDSFIPDIMKLNPKVLIISGDHSTPAAMKSHSWRVLQVLFYAKNIRKDMVVNFGEEVCMKGGLGHIRHEDLMPLAMVHVAKLIKYSA